MKYDVSKSRLFYVEPERIEAMKRDGYMIATENSPMKRNKLRRVIIRLFHLKSALGS